MRTEQTILQEKIDGILHNKLSRNNSLLNHIEKENSLLSDYIIPLGNSSPLAFTANDVLKAHFEGNDYTIHKNALGQFGDKFGIPQRYVHNLNQTDWGRNLLKDILTEHRSHIERDRVLFRTVGGQLRGVLSDRYRRLNSEQIYEQFINASNNLGATIYDVAYTDTKSYISTIIPKVFEIPTENNGNVYSVFGARISNSDFGDGALEVRAFQMNVVCMNGMVSESTLKQIHLGKKLPDNMVFSEQTYKLDTRAMASAVNDIITNTLSSDRIIETVSKIKKASSEEIDISKAIVKLPKMGMLKEEIQEVNDMLIANNYEDGVQGKATKWKLSQAITSVSNSKDARRKEELNELAGKLISL